MAIISAPLPLLPLRDLTDSRRKLELEFAGTAPSGGLISVCRGALH